MTGIEIDYDFARGLERVLFCNGLTGYDDPVVFGSTVMRLHGLKDDIGDVDLFVPARTYHRLRSRPHGDWTEERPREDDPPFLSSTLPALGLNVSVFHCWTPRDKWLDVPEAVATASRVAGLLCVKLELVARWKYEAVVTTQAAGIKIEGSPWEKHIADLFTLQAAGVDTSGLMWEAT